MKVDIELLGSKEAIAEAKCELLVETAADSVAILNHGNPLLMATTVKVWHSSQTKGEKLTK